MCGAFSRKYFTSPTNKQVYMIIIIIIIIVIIIIIIIIMIWRGKPDYPEKNLSEQM